MSLMKPFPVLIVAIASICFSKMVNSFKGGVRMTPNTEVELQESKLNSIGNGAIGELVIRSIIITRGNFSGLGDPKDSAVSKVPELDSNGMYIGVHSSECSESVLLTQMRTGKNIGADPGLLQSGPITCYWELIGAGDCVPEITCQKFSLAEPVPTDDDPCLDEYLEITDGTYGYKKYCGNFGPLKVSSARDYRDLYVTLRIASPEKAKEREVGCSVVCATEGDEDMTPLAETLEPEIVSSCTCGRKPPVERSSNRRRRADVVEARRGEFPWVASIVAAGTRHPFCTGAIINDRLVLTAAHCFRGDFINIANMEVIIHPHELNVSTGVARMVTKKQSLTNPDALKESDENDQSFRYTIERYFVHPLFVKQTNDFDVALIKLSAPIDFHMMRMISPVCLPDSGQWDKKGEGESAVDVGWGLKERAQMKDLDASEMSSLKKQTIEVYHTSECSDHFDWRFSHRMLCAGQREEESFCNGDSGAPLISEKTKMVWEQIGILAYSQECVDKKGPGLYTDLRQVVQWIRYISTKEKAVWCMG